MSYLISGSADVKIAISADDENLVSGPSLEWRISKKNHIQQYHCVASIHETAFDATCPCSISSNVTSEQNLLYAPLLTNYCDAHHSKVCWTEYGTVFKSWTTSRREREWSVVPECLRFGRWVCGTTSVQICFVSPLLRRHGVRNASLGRK